MTERCSTLLEYLNVENMLKREGGFKQRLIEYDTAQPFYYQNLQLYQIVTCCVKESMMINRSKKWNWIPSQASISSSSFSNFEWLSWSNFTNRKQYSGFRAQHYSLPLHTSNRYGRIRVSNLIFNILFHHRSSVTLSF